MLLGYMGVCPVLIEQTSQIRASRAFVPFSGDARISTRAQTGASCGRGAVVRYNRDVEFSMGRVENIEGQVRNLDSEELKAFRDWFAAFDAEVWDAQVDADAKNGKLRSLAEHALRDHESGRSSIL